jgi:hypothetical protein
VTSTPAILWETFGLTGLASAVAWALALLFLAAGITRPHRWTRWLLAMGAAIVGVVLAAATSAGIRAIEIDRSAEVLAAEAAGTKAVQEKLRSRAADIRFAEDTAADQADVAGVTVAEEEGAYERAVEEQLAKIPAYRARGKKTRAAGKTVANAGDAAASTSGETATEAGPDAAATAAEPERNVRTLPESQLVVADQFDRGNRAAAWTALLFSLGLVGMEYVRRFNSTFDPVWPLPLAGTPIDGIAGKEHVVSLPPGGLDALPAWLESLARKGESFLVLSAADLLPGRSDLPRVSLGRWRLSTPLRRFPAADLVADPSLLELAFESAWFGRASSFVIGEQAAGDVLSRLAAALESRRRCRAAAGRTLDIIWALDAEPPAEAAATIARLAAATNVRWVRAGT